MKVKAKKYMLVDCGNLLWRLCYGVLMSQQVSASVSEEKRRKTPTMHKELMTQFISHVFSYKNKFHAANVVFAWDRGEPLRKQIFPEYKTRAGMRDTTKKIIEEVAETLCDGFLPACGFANNLYQGGYEADDIIAEVVYTYSPYWEYGEIVIVSNDKDFYQLLDLALVWNPISGTCLDRDWFYKTYGISPANWATVKAIMGGHDNIQGVNKVGEKSALSYIRGELKPTFMTYKAIKDSGDLIEQNLKLVTLPYPGLQPIDLEDDEVTRDKFSKAADKFGLERSKNRFLHSLGKGSAM